MNQGDDIAGFVHAVGPGVLAFKPGDRVAAFHEIGAPGGSYAEYAVAWDHTTFHIPDKTSFEGWFSPQRSLHHILAPIVATRLCSNPTNHDFPHP